MTNPWKGEPLRVNCSGQTDKVWNGTRNSPPVMIYNFDNTNTIYAGYLPNLLLNAPNTQILPPNFGLTMDGTRSIYIIGPKNAGPVQITPGAAHPFQLSAITVVNQGANTVLGEDPSTPPVVKVQTVNNPNGTTQQFTPPGNNLLVCVIAANGCTNLANLTVSDTGGHTWTRKAGLQSSPSTPAANFAGAIYETYVATGGTAITVTVSDADNNASLLFSVRVMSNANAVQTSAGTGNNAATGNAPASTVFISAFGGTELATTQQNSWWYACAVTANGNNVDMSTDPNGGTTTIDSLDSTTVITNMILGRNATPTGPPGAINPDWQLVNPASYDFVYVIAEILHA